MGSTREMIFLLIALSSLLGLCNTCKPNQATGCPYYALLAGAKVIPLPHPSRLDENCRELRAGLNCLTGNGVYGDCDDKEHPMKQVFITMLQVIDIPCQTASQEYQSGRACLQAEPGSPLPRTMSRCYLRNRREIGSNFCSGMNEFLACVRKDMMTIPSCNDTERDIIHAMIATHINGMGTCEQILVPSLKSTTTTTTTTTPTTTTSVRPTVASTPQIPVVSTRKPEAELTKTTEMSSSNSTTTINPAYHVGKSVTSNAGSQNTAFLVHAVATLVTLFMSAC
ncbi:uncharacterized protein [Littorina saxatilis]|uniref:Uncharacterized protein n=1 Tax=Littorina saxatilis TaxID=31220 RepID=A0AAN9GAB4_9CAEN